jgi:excisionase family DNA binding protein
MTRRLNHDEASAYLKVSPSTLRTWRCTGRHKIPFYKLGRKIYYEISDLNAFLETRRFRSVAEAKERG